MNAMKNNFLKALADTIRLDCVQSLAKNSEARPSAAWHTLVRALLGVAYLLVALLCRFLFQDTLTCVLLGTVVLLLLHLLLTGGQEKALPGMVQTILRSGQNAPAPSAGSDLLARFLLPVLLFLLLLNHGEIWLPAILALAAAFGAELAQEKGENDKTTLRQIRCWLLGAAAAIILPILPALGCADAVRAVLLRGILLLVIPMLLLPWVRRFLPAKAPFLVGNFLGMTLLLALAFLTSAL